MDYAPNVRAVEIGAREVLPKVRARWPRARFRIVGRRPHPRVRALAELPGVEVTGEVADLDPHFEAAHLGLIPLPVVRGIQNKVLETLARKLPVVAFDEVARCLEPGARPCVFTGGEPEALAAQCVALLEDDRRRIEAGEAGRRYVAEHHDWERIAERWEELIAEATA